MVKKIKKDAIHDPSKGEETHDEGQAGVDTESNMEALTQKLQEKEKEAAENYDKYIRAVAELENYKKRATRERMDSLKYGQENLIRDILPLMDNLERAMDHANTSSDFEAFKEGLRLIQNQLNCCLEKQGVEKIETDGRDFDPNVHEAMLQVESPVHKRNQVVQEFEKGYLLNGRLLRPAKVSVCRLPEKQEAQS